MPLKHKEELDINKPWADLIRRVATVDLAKYDAKHQVCDDTPAMEAGITDWV
jgi:hypothetical protein